MSHTPPLHLQTLLSRKYGLLCIISTLSMLALGCGLCDGCFAIGQMVFWVRRSCVIQPYRWRFWRWCRDWLMDATDGFKDGLRYRGGRECYTILEEVVSSTKYRRPHSYPDSRYGSPRFQSLWWLKHKSFTMASYEVRSMIRSEWSCLIRCTTSILSLYSVRCLRSRARSQHVTISPISLSALSRFPVAKQRTSTIAIAFANSRPPSQQSKILPSPLKSNDTGLSQFSLWILSVHPKSH